MTEQQAADAQEGYSLIEAIKHFGPSEMVKHIDNRKDVDEFDKAFGAVPEPDSLRKLIEWFLRTIGALLKAKVSQIIALNSAKLAGHRVFDDLRIGRLIASGFDSDKSSAVREIIPSALWPGLPNLSENSLVSDGRTFTSILITQADVVPDSWAKAETRRPTDTPPPVAKGKHGRPTKRDAIVAAYGQTIKNYDLSFAEHIPAIRFAAKNILGDDSDKGLSDDVIAKTVGKLFAAEKEAAKLSAKR